MTRATVANTAVRALLAYCARRGIDTRSMLGESKIPERLVADPKARLEAAKAAGLWRDALVRTSDPSLGLHVGETVAFGSYPIFNYLALGAPTVGDGLARAASYFRLIHSAVELRTRHLGHEVEIAIVSVDPKVPLARPYIEYVLSTLFIHSRMASGVNWAPRRVELTFLRAERSREHERVFACPVAFKKPLDRLVVDSAIWSSPTLRPMPGLLDLVDAEARRAFERHAQHATSTVGRVRKEIAAALKGGAPRIDLVARHLSTTTRTLQRGLAAEGTSFAALVDQTRRDAVKAQLEAGTLSLGEIAFLVGFAEPSVLSRAVQRWFGCSPSELREKSLRAKKRRGRRASRPRTHAGLGR